MKSNNIPQTYEQFVHEMEIKFPKLFSRPYGGFAVGKGWWPIIRILCANIQSHIDYKHEQKQEDVCPQVTVLQVKEKFGKLRFYYEGGDEYVNGLVSMAETWAAHSCEVCGMPGVSRKGSWIKTWCDVHAHPSQHTEE